MAVIVRYRENGGTYVLLGGGFGAFKARNPHVLFGNLAPEDQSGEVPVALICDYAGQVAWVKTENIEVISIDGKSPADVLSADADRQEH